MPGSAEGVERGGGDEGDRGVGDGNVIAALLPAAYLKSNTRIVHGE